MNSNIDFVLTPALDLTPIKKKLMHAESGEGWSLEQATFVETEYRRFLYLSKAFPAEQVAPLEDVDTFWHYHILDTMKYARDCQEVFGYFLHHYPYVGMDGETGIEERHQAGDRMRQLYESSFGVSYARAAVQAAWCAGPGDEVEAVQTAWCAGPGQKVEAVQTAWCAGPGQSAGAVQTAWCAGPGVVKAASGQTAWCISPGPGMVKPAEVRAAYRIGAPQAN